jgi:flagellar protein FlaG
MLSSIDAKSPPVAAAISPNAPTAARAPDAPLATAPKPGTPAPHEVESALKTLNDYTAMVAQDVSFTMDEESGKTIVKVVDTATQEVLRQFPSAEALSIARSIDKMQGLLIREKA